ncbi:MAG: CerR family C-terminal domain-containing protein [Phycisphaerae bacterium]|nr:CerR family C-terminal domain-containing protein [Phycisphaerae bacterium]
MKKHRIDGQRTRSNLLDAASKCFAERCFWETTNADICSKANVNTASVNYHFGSKDNLYIEAWKHSFEKSMKAHPPDGGVPVDSAPEQRLHGRILALMRRIGDPENCEVEIIHKEMANPTGLLAETMHKVIKPIDDALKGIIEELLGSAANEQRIQFCEMSIMSQCFGPMLRLRRARTGQDAVFPKGPPFDFDAESLAEHVTQFSLAGIRAIRERTENGQTKSQGNKAAKTPLHRSGL